MNKDNSTQARRTSIERTLRSLTISKEAPKWTVAFFALLYIVTNIMTMRVAPSKEILIVGDARMPLSAFAGVLSSIGNLSIIFMVVFYKKLGFILVIPDVQANRDLIDYRIAAFLPQL